MSQQPSIAEQLMNLLRVSDDPVEFSTARRLLIDRFMALHEENGGRREMLEQFQRQLDAERAVAGSPASGFNLFVDRLAEHITCLKKLLPHQNGRELDQP